MTTKDEALAKALEALEEAVNYTSCPSWSPSMTEECNAAATAIREALAQPAGERWELLQALNELIKKFNAGWHDGIQIDATDIATLCEAEALLSADAKSSEWVGLTVDDIRETYFASRADYVDFSRAIEAKLREKNARKDMPAAADKAGWDAPVAYIQRDHLQKAMASPFLCRVEPTQRLPDFAPLYTRPQPQGEKE